MKRLTALFSALLALVLSMSGTGVVNAATAERPGGFSSYEQISTGIHSFVLTVPTTFSAAVTVREDGGPVERAAAGKKAPPLVVYFVGVRVATKVGPRLARVVVKAVDKDDAAKMAVRAVAGQGKIVKNVAVVVRASFATAGGFTIRWYATPVTANGYHTFRAFKRAFPSKKGHEWHHLVEQGSAAARRVDPRWVNNKHNLVMIPTGLHRKCINSMYSSKIRNLTKRERKQLGFSDPVYNNMKVRKALQGFDYKWNHTVGLTALRLCGVQVGKRPS